uniref:aspartyl aminopeptidase n=1 Tax=Hemiselmis andersenii TaxID=464988 RepID=A0A6U4N1B7_HEMAN|mmetsp:Transcript_2796/g.6276  ORF Transcript_2796/g.6276 Transcript_2796/m.6276 type:complete len:463 (-) Transcript_2796:165-1553(-)|eukprot:CAMPEP_0114134634 /NCGR_PEP_ID=MMETSP0043_2-20121206/14278_1 /TAXON_ID=464988 /ORGANISM="Hemiselmis andersenii, Strain CCMP644" /LENGTH=462 /DNA_ID=CAMNT_0001228319 /DNA_START=107 /DNA_END=1495 /DNA_ORIENTATION=-
MSCSAPGLLDFVNASPTPFNLVSVASTKLKSRGFVELKEEEPWNKGALKAGGKYFFARAASTFVAFAIGGAFEASNGCKVVGAHTDSPVLKLKPVSKKSAHGYMQLGVECYGGGLWHTWFDRELSLAGSVVVESNGKFERKLLHMKKPLLRIPHLCIHLQTADERAKLDVNKETHLAPILQMINDQVNKPSKDEDANKDRDSRHAPELLSLIAWELGCEVGAIRDLDVTLFDTQGGQIWGPNSEFLSSPRLDNQVHCYTSIEALADHADKDLSKDTQVSVITLFDHEEVGSDSTHGAGSPLMQDVVARLCKAFGGDEDALRVCVRNSFLISADVAHAIHPNYPGKHEGNHAPLLNKGTVIKTNSNQRYATTAATGFVVRELSRRAGVGCQEFVVRNDCPCGSTIGPIIASKTGIRTCDVGVPSLSMHSIRETIGCDDVVANYKLFLQFFEGFGALDRDCSFL